MKAIVQCVVWVIGASAVLAALPLPAVAAECRWVERSYFEYGTLVTEREWVCSPGSIGADDGGSAAPDVPSPCELNAERIGRDPSEFCQEAAQPPGPAPAQVTPGIAAAVWREIELPPSRLTVQPPDGRTLVNFETNFYTEPAQFERTLTLLGQRVEFRIWASAYTWRFGDGEERSTTDPGAPYPNLDVTHDYRRAGRYQARVDTTYAAEFRVGGGAWQPVPGSATIPGEPVPLEAVEARPLLVG